MPMDLYANGFLCLWIPIAKDAKSAKTADIAKIA